MAGLAPESRGSVGAPQLPSLGTRQLLSLHSPPHPTPGEGTLGTESWLSSKSQGPWSPAPAAPSPSPRTKYTAPREHSSPLKAGRPAGRAPRAAQRDCGPGAEAHGAPPGPSRALPVFVTGARADAIAPEEFALAFPNLPDPTRKRPRDAVGGADAEDGVGPGGLRAELHSPRRPGFAAPAPGALGCGPEAPTTSQEINACFC